MTSEMRYQHEDQHLRLNAIKAWRLQVARSTLPTDLLSAGKMTFEKVLKNDIGTLGKWQILSFCLIMIPADLPLSMIPQLANLAPKYVCNAPWFAKWSYEEVQNFSSSVAHMRKRMNDTAAFDAACQRLNLSSLAVLVKSNRTMAEKVERVARQKNLSQESCSSWLYYRKSAPYRHSLIQQFNLVCGRKLLIPNSLVSYAIGMAFGQLIGGQLSDRFGRAPVIKISFLLTSAGLLMIGLCSNIWVFLAMRALIGLVHNAGLVSGIAKYVESTTDRHRNTMNFFHGLIFDLVGIPVIILISFLLQDWRFVHLSAGVIILIFTAFQIAALRESPRWLIAKGRYADALKSVRQAIHMNKRDKDRSKTVSIDTIMPVKAAANPQVNRGFAVVYHDWAEFFRTPEITRRVVPMVCIWITIPMIFYGVSFYSVRLDGNPYLIAFVLTLTSVPGDFIKFLLVAKIGRKKTIFVLMIGSTVFMAVALVSMLVPGIPQVVIIVMATLVMTCTSACFTFMYMYSAELFRTIHRTKAIGFFAFFGQLGLIAGSFVERLDEIVWNPLPLVIFVSMQVLSVVASVFLPGDDHRLLRDASKTDANEDEDEEEDYRKRDFRIHL